ncbi:MAG TPA: GAF domain-containing protein [Nitrospirae bacterium]|nr:GAF domain-containing protein [Nitrospirota bacterium]
MFGNKYKEMLEAVNDAIYCIDKSFRVIYFNKAFEVLIGFPPSEIKGNYIYNLLKYFDSKGLNIELDEYPCIFSIKSSKSCSKELTLKDYYSDVFPIEESAFPIQKGKSADSCVCIIKKKSIKIKPCVSNNLLTICAWCKKIHCLTENWISIENYLAEMAEVNVTHGMCPNCASKIFDKKIYLESYQDICKAISSSVSLKEVFDLIVKNIVKVMNVKASMLRLINNETNTLEVAAYYGLSENYVNKGPVDLDKSVKDTMEGKTVSIYDISTDTTARYNKEAMEEGIRTILSVPLRKGSEMIGVLRMYTDEPVHYTEEDFKFINALAEQAAIAIVNAKTFEMTVSKAKEFLRVFQEVTQAVNSTLDLEEVLRLIVRKIPETMKLKGATVRLLKGKRLVLVADYGLSKEYLNKGPIDMEQNVKIALQKGAVAIYDVSRDDRVIYKKEAQKEGIKSMLTLPIMARNKEVIGILRLFTEQHRHFTDEEISYTSSLAEVCGYAIENARLFEQIKSKK